MVGINCADMRDVKAEACMRQFVEDELQLVRNASRALAVVHVLQDQARAELAIWSEVAETVRMGHDRSHPEWQVSQGTSAHGVVQLAILSGRMDAYVAEWEPRLASEIRD